MRNTWTYLISGLIPFKKKKRIKKLKNWRNHWDTFTITMFMNNILGFHHHTQIIRKSSVFYIGGMSISYQMTIKTLKEIVLYKYILK